MWFSAVWTLIDNGTRHHSGQNVGTHEAQSYANELLVRVRLSCLKLLQTRSTCRKKKMLGKRVMTSILLQYERQNTEIIFFRARDE